jgi:hypothetical protein
MLYLIIDVAVMPESSIALCANGVTQALAIVGTPKTVYA